MSPPNRVMDLVSAKDYLPSAVCLPARPSGWPPHALDLPLSPEGHIS
jgi:hypothetical protein